MKVFSFLFFFCTLSYSCHLDEEYEFFSLSGPVTQILQELNLLNNKPLKGVSSFHFVETSAQKIDGGIFLSSRFLKEFNKPVVFYDESEQLAKLFPKIPQLKSHQVLTRKSDLYDINLQAINQVLPYLKNCGSELVKLNSSLGDLKEKITQQKKMTPRLIFYLGKLTNTKKPQLVMSNDLFVKKWRELKKIETYPSTLEYATWSVKVLKDLENGYIEIGLNHGEERIEKVEMNKFNLFYPHILTPGLSQIKFMANFSRLLKKMKEVH